jgi:phosphatidylserine/phosphatidylglycerophosphate/cardiolipin synthase-like enzyme
MSVFSELARPSLEALAGAFESDRIATGNLLTLRQYVPVDACVEVGREIDGLIRGGVPPRQVAYILRALIHERDHSTVRPGIELVWTGPQGMSSNSRDTGVVVRELFTAAKRSVLLAGFAVHRGREIFKDLEDRMTEDPSLEVTMFLNIPRAARDTTIAEEIVGRFAYEFRREHWGGSRCPVTFYDPRALAIDPKKRTSLHAKCVVVDSTTSLVTSANFTEAAQVRNIEVGALVHDVQFARSIIGQFDALIRSRAVVRLPLG